MEGLLFKFKEFKKIGFIFKDMDIDQISYVASISFNKFLENNFNVSVSVFNIDGEGTSFPTKFPVYDFTYLRDFRGILVSTDRQTALYLNHSPNASRFHYVYELDMDDPVLYNDSVVKFTRCKDYQNILAKKGVNVSNIIVDDFDFKAILEATNKGNN